jgi:hypothetical protein
MAQVDDPVEGRMWMRVVTARRRLGFFFFSERDFRCLVKHRTSR